MLGLIQSKPRGQELHQGHPHGWQEPKDSTAAPTPSASGWSRSGTAGIWATHMACQLCRLWALWLCGSPGPSRPMFRILWALATFSWWAHLPRQVQLALLTNDSSFVDSTNCTSRENWETESRSREGSNEHPLIGLSKAKGIWGGRGWRAWNDGSSKQKVNIASPQCPSVIGSRSKSPRMLPVPYL